MCSFTYEVMERLRELKGRAACKILLILLWQLTLPFIQSTELNMDDLLPELLQLQPAHCGGMALCDDANHVEPDFGVLIMPCCVPCSCLPTCRALDICCPNFNDSMVDADGPNRNETGLKAENAIVTHEAMLHSDDNKSRQIDVQTENNSTEEGAWTIKERFICIRPQIQREQNVYLDSPAYRMIGKCPAEQSGTTLDKHCKKGFDNVGFKNIVPVTSDTTNMTYVNIHCLNCNENNNPGNKIKYWSPIITVEAWHYYHNFYKDPQDILSYLLKYEYFNGMKTGNIHFLPANPKLLQPCQRYDVTSCNKTGLWDTYNETTKQLCLSGYSLPVIRWVKGKTLLFRNAACLYCNLPYEMFGKFAKVWGTCSTPNTVFPPRFNMALNLPDLNPSINKENNNIMDSREYTDATAVLTLMKQTNSCKDDNIAILDTCRKVLCPRDHYNKDGYCIPLYDALSGIALHIKFEIKPNRQIARSDRLDFAKTLNYLANLTLKQTTSLHCIHSSIWYLPRSDTNPDEFYLLNMLLSSRGDVVKFDKSMKEVRDFYLTLKTNSKVRHKNASTIKLELKFAYRVEFVGDKPIIYVLGGVSPVHQLTTGRRIQDAGPGMTISEANWCYRTAIMRNETKAVAKYVLTMKQTGIKLYRDQVERNGLEYYVCLELLHTDIEEKITVLRKRPTIINDSKETDATPWYSNKTTVITIVIFVMVLLTIMFCKFKANTFKNRTLNNLRQGVETTTASPDFDEQVTSF